MVEGDHLYRPAVYVTWRERRGKVVAIVEDYVAPPEWWLTGETAEMHYWKVRAKAGRFELIMLLREQKERWIVEKVYD